MELHDWRIANGTNRGGPNSHKSKKGTKNANGKGKLKKGRQNNNAWNKLKTKVVALVKATATKAKEETENDDGMTAQIYKKLISFSNGNNPPQGEWRSKELRNGFGNETSSYHQELREIGSQLKALQGFPPS